MDKKLDLAIPRNRNLLVLWEWERRRCAHTWSLAAPLKGCTKKSPRMGTSPRDNHHSQGYIKRSEHHHYILLCANSDEFEEKGQHLAPKSFDFLHTFAFFLIYVPRTQLHYYSNLIFHAARERNYFYKIIILGLTATSLLLHT